MVFTFTPRTAAAIRSLPKVLETVATNPATSWNMGVRLTPGGRATYTPLAPPNSPRENWSWKYKEIMPVYEKFKLLGIPTIEHWSELDSFTKKDEAEGWTLESWENFKWLEIEKDDFVQNSDDMEPTTNPSNRPIKFVHQSTQTPAMNYQLAPPKSSQDSSSQTTNFASIKVSKLSRPNLSPFSRKKSPKHQVRMKSFFLQMTTKIKEFEEINQR